MKAILPALFASLVFLQVRPLAAADGRIPISSAPFTISSPGHYYLTRNLGPTGGAEITITSGNVTLDLGGHTLTASPGLFNYGIQITGGDNVTVMNGAVTGGDKGIDVTNSSGATRRIRLANLNVSQFWGFGFSLLAQNAGSNFIAIIENNRINYMTGNCQYGIYLYAAVGGRIEGNTVSNCRNAGNSGIGVGLISPSGVTVTRNTVTGSGGYGISINSGTNNSATDNHITSTSGGGLTINGSGNVYSRNHSTGHSANFIIGPSNYSGGGNCLNELNNSCF